MAKLAPVVSLADLAFRAKSNPEYAKLAIVSAENLGGMNIKTVNDAMRWLNISADETDEDGVVAEVNFCR